MATRPGLMRVWREAWRTVLPLPPLATCQRGLAPPVCLGWIVFSDDPKPESSLISKPDSGSLGLLQSSAPVQEEGHGRRSEVPVSSVHSAMNARDTQREAGWSSRTPSGGLCGIRSSLRAHHRPDAGVKRWGRWTTREPPRGGAGTMRN